MHNETSIDRLHAFVKRQAERDQQLDREIAEMYARQAAILERMEKNLQESINTLKGLK